MTKERMAALLSEHKSIRTVPSPHSLAALLSKNPQIVSVGKESVENVVGVKANHLIYDIDRKLIQEQGDINKNTDSNDSESDEGSDTMREMRTYQNQTEGTQRMSTLCTKIGSILSIKRVVDS